MYLWPWERCARHFQQTVDLLFFWKPQLQQGSAAFIPSPWIHAAHSRTSHCLFPLSLLVPCPSVPPTLLSSSHLSGARAAISPWVLCPQKLSSEITIWLKTCETAASKQRQHFETFKEEMEWEEKRTLIQLGRNLEMQEMKKRENVCVNVLAVLKTNGQTMQI